MYFKVKNQIQKVWNKDYLWSGMIIILCVWTMSSIIFPFWKFMPWTFTNFSKPTHQWNSDCFVVEEAFTCINFKQHNKAVEEEYILWKMRERERVWIILNVGFDSRNFYFSSFQRTKFFYIFFLVNLLLWHIHFPHEKGL